MTIRDDQWEGGLFEAFKAPDGESVLDAIHRLHGVRSNFLLRDADEGATPVLLRRETDGAGRDDRRYQILGEIARGGIGVIYKGRDKDLNRDVALKVLRPEYAFRDDVIRRFVEEAQVGGQLQHPGIVPIYALGLKEDGRPCFAMKLIKGQTLAALLDRNPRGIDLLSVFEQISQTMAYAHSRGVIHRDLKPANVMVGAFGEVQVVDWGFAKILGRDELTPRPEQTVIATDRSSNEGSDSVAGSVMGTPAYMPPEQALGRIDELDERADVFALGAILCEILTGEPPYSGPQMDQLIAASQCLLDPALLRIEEAEAADDLKQLVRDCLSPLPGDRPESAAVLAGRLSDHFAGLEEQARQAELDALEAEARAVRDRKGRIRSLVLAGIAFVAVLAGSVGYLSWRTDRSAREERAAGLIATAVREARRQEGEARWPSALTAVRKAIDIARSEGVDDAGPRQLLAELEQRRDAAGEALRLEEADGSLLAGLEEARALAGDHYDRTVIDARYSAAIKKRWPTGEVDTDRLRASLNASRFAAAFDAWAFSRRDTEEFGEEWEEIESWARAIDPGTNHIRDALTDGDALEALVQSGDAESLPVAVVAMIGYALNDAGREETAVLFLKQGHRRHPDDFWVNLALAEAHRGDEVAVQHCYAALAVRPKSVEARHWLGISLEESGDLEGAMEAWRDVLDQQPDWAHGVAHVAIVLGKLGRHDEAEEAWAEASRIDPDDSTIHDRLGPYLMERGKLPEAVTAFENAVEHDPDDVEARIWLGSAYRASGRFAEAERVHQQAVGMAPEYPNSHFHLGYTYLVQARYPAAIESFLRVIEIDGDNADAFTNLGYCYSESGDHERAVAACRKATELNQESQNAWTMLSSLSEFAGDQRDAARAYGRAVAINEGLRHQYGMLLIRLGLYVDAIGQFRRILEAEPGQALATYFLGTALFMAGESAQAVPYLEEVIRKNPLHSEAWCNLGISLRDVGRYQEAREKLERGNRLGSVQPNWGFPSARWLARAESMVSLEPRLRKAIKGEEIEATPEERAVLAVMLTIEGHHADSLRFFQQAFREDPTLLEYGRFHTYPAVKAAARAGEPGRKPALEWLRGALLDMSGEIETDSPTVYANLLHWQGDPVLGTIRDARDQPEDWVEFWAEVERTRKRARARMVELSSERSR